jgi:hypothetical protein
MLPFVGDLVDYDVIIAYTCTYSDGTVNHGLETNWNLNLAGKRIGR